MSAVVGIGDHLGRQLPVSLLVPISVASVDTTYATLWRRCLTEEFIVQHIDMRRNKITVAVFRATSSESHKVWDINSVQVFAYCNDTFCLNQPWALPCPYLWCRCMRVVFFYHYGFSMSCKELNKESTVMINCVCTNPSGVILVLTNSCHSIWKKKTSCRPNRWWRCWASHVFLWLA